MKRVPAQDNSGEYQYEKGDIRYVSVKSVEEFRRLKDSYKAKFPNKLITNDDVFRKLLIFRRKYIKLIRKLKENGRTA